MIKMYTIYILQSHKIISLSKRLIIKIKYICNKIFLYKCTYIVRHPFVIYIIINSFHTLAGDRHLNINNKVTEYRTYLIY